MLCWALDSVLCYEFGLAIALQTIFILKVVLQSFLSRSPAYYTSNQFSPCIHARALQICATELGEAEPHARDCDWIADAAVHLLSVKIAATAL